MTDTRTTWGIARSTATVAIAFAFMTALGACGGGTGEGGGEDNGGRNETTQEASGTERYVLPGEQGFPEGVGTHVESPEPGFRALWVTDRVAL